MEQSGDCEERAEDSGYEWKEEETGHLRFLPGDDYGRALTRLS
jgi:hypothetical protein